MSFRSAVVLLSGGLDSATTLAIAREQGFRLLAMSFRYGQRHAIEIDAAKRVAASMNVARHITIDIDLRTFGGSALTSELAVPKGREANDSGEIPVTYVPARNTIFLSYALALAEVENSRDIFIGVNAVDYSGYPDCRPEFIRAFEQMANLATKAAVEGKKLTIHAPLISMTKAEIIRTGIRLGVDFGTTSSCYDPDLSGRACGECDSCNLRRAGFIAAGVPDPTRYVA
jgi:7-cyano-7-deazaguanine synthase